MVTVDSEMAEPRRPEYPDRGKGGPVYRFSGVEREALERAMGDGSGDDGLRFVNALIAAVKARRLRSGASPASEPPAVAARVPARTVPWVSKRAGVSSAQFHEARDIIAAGKLPYKVKPALVHGAPFLGYGDPMADPRVSGYVELSFGRVVRIVGRPC